MCINCKSRRAALAIIAGIVFALAPIEDASAKGRNNQPSIITAGQGGGGAGPVIRDHRKTQAQKLYCRPGADPYHHCQTRQPPPRRG